MTPKQLKIWMWRFDYTTRGLARDLGVAQSTITRWRGGEHPIPAIALPALAGLGYRYAGRKKWHRLKARREHSAAR